MTVYIVFSGSTYYPCGGWEDFYAIYPTEAEAKAACLGLVKGGRYNDWAHYATLTLANSLNDPITFSHSEETS